MARGKAPWMKFYPSDWRSDPKVRMCSMAARGLWVEMLALMHEAAPRGHLIVSGQRPTDTQLSVLTGCPTDHLPDLLGELESAGVFSRTSKGVIYSRRMTRDEKKAQKARKNGQYGGNPTLCNTMENPASDNPQVNGQDKTQRPEARGQKENLRPKTRKRVSYPEDFETYWSEYPRDANMSKKEAWLEWQKLDDEDRQAAIASLPAFKAYCRKAEDYRVIHASRYLKYRRFDGHLEASREFNERQQAARVKLVKGTPPFEAWNAYRQRQGQRPVMRSEWWFPSEWPPGHPNNVESEQ